MNQPETIPPAKYILESFAPTSRIAVLALNRDFPRDRTAHHQRREGRQPGISGLASSQEREWLGHLCYVE